MCKHVLSPASIEENNIFKDIVPIHRWGVSGYITTSSDEKIAKDKDIPLFERYIRILGGGDAGTEHTLS